MKKIIKTIDIDGNNMFINIRTINNYFSITCEVYEKGKIIIDENYLYGGCAHDEILKVRKDLKPIVELHLSNLSGIPMYLFRNGFYFFQICIGTAKYHEKESNDFEKYSKILAEHLRIDLKDCLGLIDKLKSLENEEMQEAEFYSFCNDQLGRYKNEAEKGLKFIESL